MNTHVMIIVASEFLMQLSFVLSYTVVLKPVKHLYPSVKVYKYELRHPKVVSDGSAQFFYPVNLKPVLGQRLYPVVVKRDPNFRTRNPVKKDRKKFVGKFSTTTEKPNPRDHRLFGPSQQLVPPLSNQIEEYSEGKEEENREQDTDLRPLLPLHLPQDDRSFSSFGQEKGRIYNKPGEWAVPAPSTDSDNATKTPFTPSQLYLQVRHKNTVIHVPQTEALKDAETLEELINAPRLKELARTTHVQEVYSEEGYEDAGYDHAGQIRHAQHGEVYDAKDEGKFRIKEPPIIIDYDSDLEESKKISLENASKNKNILVEGDENGKLEPRITRSRTEANKTSVEYAKTPHNYKGEHIYSSRVKAPLNFKNQDDKEFNFTASSEQASFPSFFDEIPPPPENIFTNVSAIPFNQTGKMSSRYRQGEVNSTKIYPVSESRPAEASSSQVNAFTDFKPYLSIIDSQASPSAKNLKYSRIYSKKTKHLKLEPYKTGDIYQPPPPPLPPTLPPVPPPKDDLHPPLPANPPSEEEPLNQRIVLPTIGYINSLTTAHFGKGGSTSPVKEDPKSHLTKALNLTQALNYLRVNKNLKSLDTTEPPTESDIRTFEPMKLKKLRFNSGKLLKKNRRDVYLIKEREKRSEESQTEGYEGNDESDQPHNDKNEEIAEDERRRIEEENREKEKYEQDLRQEISNQEKEILRETFKNIGVEKDVSEVFPEFPSSGYESEDEDYSDLEEERKPVDPTKYPYYFSKKLPENSALRYATDQQKFPRKSGFKMEFYESREEVIQCPDFHPDLDDLPNSNSTEYSENQPGDNQRLAGVGDKIMCLRSKYFDPEPFDNPIFKEKEIDYVGKPKKGIKYFQEKIKGSETKTEPKSTLAKKEEKPESTANKQENFKTKGFPYTITIQYQIPDQQSTTSNLSNNQQKQSLPVKILRKPDHHLSLKQNLYQKVNEKAKNLPRETFETLPQSPQKVNQVQKTLNRKNFLPVMAIAPKRIFIPFNCLNIINKLEVLKGNKNVVLFCKDAVIIKEIKGSDAYLRILPKESGGKKKNKVVIKPVQLISTQSNWVPIPGYIQSSTRTANIPLVSRKTDEVTITKNQTSLNSSSDHYVIDELREDENVRKGEVVEDMDHYLKLMRKVKAEAGTKTLTEDELLKTKNETTSRKKRDAQVDQNVFKKKSDSAEKLNKFFEIPRTQKNPENGKNEPTSSRPFEKRTLTRLSGLDFLTRYHKNKGKLNAREKTADFWKAPNQAEGKKPQKPQIKPAQVESPLINTTPASKTKSSDFSDIRRLTTAPTSTAEKYKAKPAIKKTNDFREVPSLSSILEKTTKKIEKKEIETAKPLIVNTEKIGVTTEKVNLTIIAKVSKKTSESTEKPRTVQQTTKDSGAKPEKNGYGASKPGAPQYKTINRNASSAKKSESEGEMSRYIGGTDGPILYYVVDERTGRGEWITDYEETQSSGKPRKSRKRNLRFRNEKRRKKSKN